MKDDARDVDVIWMAAVEAWSSGDLPLAFHLCQAAATRGKDDAELNGLMASIALGLGQFDRARIYLDAAAALALANFVQKQRYLVIQPWGCGFWGEVDHVLCQLAVAEITGRIPIVHWGARGTYAATGRDNSWEAYFQPVSSVRLDDLRGCETPIFPAYWASTDDIRLTSVERGRPHDRRTSALYALSASEEIVVVDGYSRMHDVVPWAPPEHWIASTPVEEIYRRLCAAHLRLVPELAGEVDRLSASILSRRPVLGVHFRAQTASKDNESFEHRWLSWQDYFPTVDHFIETTPAGAVFLLTDLRPCLEDFRARYGTRLLSLKAQRLDRPDQIEVRLKADADVEAAARQVILDVYLASRCDAFLGDGASGVSCAVGHLKKWPPGTFHLLRANVALTPGRIQV
jgi:hypothetical protein